MLESKLVNMNQSVVVSHTTFLKLELLIFAQLKHTKYYMSIRGAGRWILLPVGRARLAVAPCFQPLCKAKRIVTIKSPKWPQSEHLTPIKANKQISQTVMLNVKEVKPVNWIFPVNRFLFWLDVSVVRRDSVMHLFLGITWKKKFIYIYCNHS